MIMPTRAFRIVAIIITALCIYACSHPIEIVGEGDVISASGNRNCYLEDFQAGQDNCSKNYVDGAYQETYYAKPRTGWQFDHWGNEYCPDAAPPNYDCSFDVAAAVVRDFWGQTMPPLQAVFTPITGTKDFYYTGHYQAQSGPAPPGRCPAGHTLTNWRSDGQALDMEKIVVTGSHCLNSLDFSFVAGQGLMTYSNGDTLTSTYAGTTTILPPTYAHWYLVSTVTGGTGRFEGATGTIYDTGLLDIATHGGPEAMVGKLNY
jgi:hypothetical protein